ncbi:MAG: DUF58 domain-containing protein [Rhodospirillales bacterium]
MTPVDRRHRRQAMSPDGGAASSSLLVAGQTLAATLPPLLVQADRVAATVWQGVHGRRRVGQGDAFWQFRPYVVGDPPQRIDWKQSAKSDGLFVRQSEWEATQSVWLWRDASASMAYRSSPALPSKRQRAELLLMALAALLARGGEHLALLGEADPPATGRPALLRLAAALAKQPQATGDLPAASPLPRYARIVLIGDLLVPLEELRSAVAALTGAGVRGHLVHIIDPAEEALPFAGRVRISGTEAEGEIVFGRVESVRDAYRARFAAHRDGLRAIVRTFGWTLLTHHTDQPPTGVLMSLFFALAGPQGASGPC